MSGIIRNAVSKEKRRYKKDGFDLDLAYIGDRIIAMGFPSEKVEGIYRNPMHEVLRFLDLKHKDRYKVYNLCSERGYDPQKFYNRVGVYPFDDHNAPPFDLIIRFCRDVQAWLAEDERNIAVIHCKAGKGRTGLMICAWLVYNKDWASPEDAMSYYALARTNNQKGVTIPSQIRYVRYFHESLNTLGWENPTFEPRMLILERIIFHTLPKTAHLSDINFTIDVGKTEVFRYKDHVDKLKLKDEPKVLRVEKKKKKGKGKEEEAEDEAVEDIATFDCGKVPVQGDVRVDFEHKGGRIFQFWFNTYFVKEEAAAQPAGLTSSSSGSAHGGPTLRLVIPKEGLDKAFKDKKNHKLYDEHFRVELVFTEVGPTPTRTKSTIISPETLNHVSNNNNDTITSTTVTTTSSTSADKDISVTSTSSTSTSTDPVLNGPTTSTVEVTSVVVTTPNHVEANHVDANAEAAQSTTHDHADKPAHADDHAHNHEHSDNHPHEHADKPAHDAHAHTTDEHAHDAHTHADEHAHDESAKDVAKSEAAVAESETN